MLPTLSGLMTPDLYAAVSLTVGGLQVSATVGWPQSWPQGLNACDFVLGQSVLARYCVTFDGANGLVGLIPQTPPAPSSSDPVFIEPGLHHVGVQVRWRGGQFEVINVLPWSPNRGNVKPGDILTLPGVALTGPEAINVLDRTLSSSGPGHVVVEVGGQAVQMALAPVF